MKTLTLKRKVLLGALAIVVVGWMLDALVGAGRPSAAQAQPDDANTTALAPMREKAAQLAPLIAALGRSAHDPAKQIGVPTGRDPFRSPAGLDAIIATPPESTPPPMDTPAEPLRASEPPFEQRHTLQGVVAGPTSLALIDGVLLASGDRVDGAELLDIQRDRVVLMKDGKRILLTLSPAGTP